MKDYYCFDILFNQINFDDFVKETEKCETNHHAHLSYKSNVIEIKILYNSKTCFGHKLSRWVATINWKYFGNHVLASNIQDCTDLLKIDFSSAVLLGVSTGSNQTEGTFQYVIVNIDRVKLNWSPNVEKANSAEFYLNPIGFNAVKTFYTPLLETNPSEFSFQRMNGLDCFYPIGNGEFRPEFNFWLKDSKLKDEAKIVKEPKFQFRYKCSVTEEEALINSDIVRLLTSFFLHDSVEFVVSKIFLEDKTVTIHRVVNQSVKEAQGNFWGFKNYWDLHKLYSSAWQAPALLNRETIDKSVEMFLHALSVYNSARYLIFYNIIEIIKGADSQIKTEFTPNPSLKPEDIKKKYEEALVILMETIEASQQNDFRNKWQGISGKLKFKPMKSPIEEFLRKAELKPENFPISLKRIIELRDDYTHGSTNSAQSDELNKANIFLYRITGILILRLFGIKEWELDLELK